MKIAKLMQTQTINSMISIKRQLVKISFIPLLAILFLMLNMGYGAHTQKRTLSLSPSLSQAQTLLANINQSYGTYVGGNSDDRVRAVTVDENGNIYLTGSTYSTDFPGPNGGKQNSSEDLFVMRLNPQGTAVVWTTYLSGSNSEAGHALALDGNGSLWVTGYTSSTDFPVSAGSNSFAGYNDIIAVKLNASNGVTQYSAMYGGEHLDEGNGLAISPTTGQIYITGALSDEFGRSNVLIMILNKQNYNVQALSYFGRERGRDVGYGIALDSDNNVYITGQTEPSGQDTDFPLSQNPFQAECGLATSSGECSQDGFLTIISPNATNILYSSYIGGSYNNNPDGYSNDASTGIAVGTDGSVYLTGYTFANDFPVANAIQSTKRGANNFPDAFVMRLNPATNDLIFSTYLGGNDWDEGHALTLDSQGNVYIGGMTDALNFPTQNASQPILGGGICSGANRYCYDAFITKLTNSGALDWSTFLGGSSDDNAYGIALNTAGMPFVVGDTHSSDFPVSQSALQPSKNMSRDGFLASFGNDGNIPSYDYDIYIPMLVR